MDKVITEGRMLHGVPTKLGKLSVVDEGAGRTLLFWHSLFGSTTQFHSQIDTFKKEYRVLAIDGPGHGLSETIKRPFTNRECAEAVVEILDHKNIESVIMVGVSWGSRVAMEFALLAPERVSRLVLMAANAESEPLKTRITANFLALLYRCIPTPAFFKHKAAASMITPSALKKHPQLADIMAKSYFHCRRISGYYAIQALFVHLPDIRERIKSIQVPTLVIVGGKDSEMAQRRGKDIAELIPGARLEILPEAGHLVTLEQPESVNKLIYDFLTNIN